MLQVIDEEGKKPHRKEVSIGSYDFDTKSAEQSGGSISPEKLAKRVVSFKQIT